MPQVAQDIFCAASNDANRQNPGKGNHPNNTGKLGNHPKESEKETDEQESPTKTPHHYQCNPVSASVFFRFCLLSTPSPFRDYLVAAPITDAGASLVFDAKIINLAL
jgi:hypothetical protein